MSRRYRVLTLLLVGVWLISTSISSFPPAADNAHGHAVTHVWAHGHLHTVLHHHDEPAEDHDAAASGRQYVIAGVGHDGADQVVHALSVYTPIVVSKRLADPSLPASTKISSPARSMPSVVPVHAGTFSRAPTLASLRVTVLLV